MIKAAFFDIDGTLVSLKTKVYPPSTKTALEALRRKGILCFVATGRSKFEMASERLLAGLEFDGYLTNNGQDAYDAAGRLIYGKPLNPEEVRALYRWAEKTRTACWMVSAEQSMINLINDRVRTAMVAIHTQPPLCGSLEPMLDKPVYKVVLFLPREEMDVPMKLVPQSRKTQWFELGHDIISLDGGKKNAMLEILEHRNISPQEAIAFGDSENDLEMLEAAGIGVAMGNGTDACKAIADYVTEDCDDDGILHALQHFKIL